MKVKFHPAAADDLDSIFSRIAEDNPRAARELIARIEAKVMRLATPELTYMGRVGQVQGTRELVEYPYIIVYHVLEEAEEVVVVAVVHGARDRTP
ncbi:MAG: toxin ParE1/3/4 [Variibacter sp.]|jgi:addiction module RelE/StbE family toxin|nr:toxin ParE1/3/4 [Variibacter sp.]